MATYVITILDIAPFHGLPVLLIFLELCEEHSQECVICAFLYDLLVDVVASCLGILSGSPPV